MLELEFLFVMHELVNTLCVWPHLIPITIFSCCWYIPVFTKIENGCRVLPSLLICRKICSKPCSAQYWASGISSLGVGCHSLQTKEIFWIVKNHHSLKWKISSKNFFFIHVDSQTLDIIFQTVCSKWEIYKNNDFLYLGDISTWVTYFWDNMFLSIYPLLSLCQCNRGVETLAMVIWAIIWAWNPSRWGVLYK